LDKKPKKPITTNYQMSEEKSTQILTDKQEEERWSDLDYLLKRKGPFAQEGFVTEGEFTSKIFLHEYCKVLIIGAGGLGCDLLKNLAMSGFKDIHIIDMDTIDVSNLNRQFLFREKDVGSSKAETAAKFVNERVPGVKVTPFVGKIQDKDDDYYRQFHIIIAGLDSIMARQWINKKLCDLVEFKDEEQTIVDMTTVKPLIDGGTEGFKGQARIIYPRVNACFECKKEIKLNKRYNEFISKRSKFCNVYHYLNTTFT
jgi:NEDD8-activating enzyme E1